MQQSYPALGPYQDLALRMFRALGWAGLVCCIRSLRSILNEDSV